MNLVPLADKTLPHLEILRPSLIIPSWNFEIHLNLGDTTFDFRNKTTSNKNFIPSYESDFSENFEASFVTDDYIAMTAPQNSSYIYTLFPNVAIGRLIAQKCTRSKNLSR